MQETYQQSGRSKKLSAQEIQKMKENMRKVPEIQKKADIYHQKEKEKAEALLNASLEESSISIKENNSIIKKESLWEKIKNYLFR